MQGEFDLFCQTKEGDRRAHGDNKTLYQPCPISNRLQVMADTMILLKIVKKSKFKTFWTDLHENIHAKWINDGDTSSRSQGVGRPRVIKEKGCRRLSRLVKQNPRQTMAQMPAQYNEGSSASVSEHIVQRTLLDMGLCSRRLTRVPLLTKLYRQLRLQLAREHRDLIMDE
ncbi:hypothetical protein AVEN_83600-1 [Araneus ventricosus]|uniref:Transposase Tc1-like domain-containing protein n=1 Tax=Araneus ventricosus TaxID=182803 RepID=A0A4Y2WQJ8_ARAVE|nr:hypothetical protein AVEN_83600-1 [Araneus ventricosus]